MARGTAFKRRVTLTPWERSTGCAGSGRLAPRLHQCLDVLFAGAGVLYDGPRGWHTIARLANGHWAWLVNTMAWSEDDRIVKWDSEAAFERAATFELLKAEEGAPPWGEILALLKMWQEDNTEEARNAAGDQGAKEALEHGNEA